MGEKFDENAGDAMPPGSFMAMPAEMKHYAWETEETVVQVHGEGPFAIENVTQPTTRGLRKSRRGNRRRVSAA